MRNIYTEEKRTNRERQREMGSLGEMLKHPEDFCPLLKLKMADIQAGKQIPDDPNWAFCYAMLHKVSRSFALVIQRLDPQLRSAIKEKDCVRFVADVKPGHIPS